MHHWLFKKLHTSLKMDVCHKCKLKRKASTSLKIEKPSSKKAEESARRSTRLAKEPKVPKPKVPKPKAGKVTKGKTKKEVPLSIFNEKDQEQIRKDIKKMLQVTGPAITPGTGSQVAVPDKAQAEAPEGPQQLEIPITTPAEPQLEVPPKSVASKGEKGMPVVTLGDWTLDDSEQEAGDEGAGDDDDGEDDMYYNDLHQSEFANPEHVDISGMDIFVMEIPQSSTSPVTPTTDAVAEEKVVEERTEPPPVQEPPAQEPPVSEASSFQFQVVDIPVSTTKSPRLASGESVMMEVTPQSEAPLDDAPTSTEKANVGISGTAEKEKEPEVAKVSHEVPTGSAEAIMTDSTVAVTEPAPRVVEVGGSSSAIDLFKEEFVNKLCGNFYESLDVCIQMVLQGSNLQASTLKSILSHKVEAVRAISDDSRAEPLAKLMEDFMNDIAQRRMILETDSNPEIEKELKRFEALNKERREAASKEMDGLKEDMARIYANVLRTSQDTEFAEERAASLRRNIRSSEETIAQVQAQLLKFQSDLKSETQKLEALRMMSAQLADEAKTKAKLSEDLEIRLAEEACLDAAALREQVVAMVEEKRKAKLLEIETTLRSYGQRRL